MKIRLLPSQREFDQLPNESVLDAALRAGVALDYGCTAGTCGKCVARVITGAVTKISHSDFMLTEAERAQNSVLLCCNSATTDALLEVHEAEGSADIPLQTLDLRVRKLEVLSPQMVLLHLRAPRSNTLRFLAGQRAQLDFGAGITRQLSIASCPCDSLNLQFHIPASDAALFARIRELSSNETVRLRGPFGSFVFEEHSGRPSIFIAYDSGFAPIKSLLEHTLSLDREQAVHVLWLAAPHGHYLHNYCRALTDALDNVHYVPLLNEGAGHDVLSQALNCVENAGGFDVYLSAPGAALAQAHAALTECGVSAERIFSEATDAVFNFVG
ncbi:MAG: 2Fe-2S iron-sulfur cluster binding domain-containing protein [Gammaproteobacteria bacterium]|nr:2Fe-2S iron-sulfur cluster binding domain-containing protein [Gammaproteobacteria bacterium]